MGIALTGAAPKTFAVTVTNTAARVLAVASDGAPRATSGGVEVYALSTNSVVVYIGGSDVSTSNGRELSAGASVYLPVDDPSRIYCVCASGSPELRILYI